MFDPPDRWSEAVRSMRSVRLALGLVTVAGVWFVQPGRGDVQPLGAVCSLLNVPIARNPEATYFVGSALPDTVLAGAGEVEPSEGASGLPGAVYGQVVRVMQVDGPGRDTLHSVFAGSGSRDVVLVPWGHDTACEPAYWDESARWIGLEREVFFETHLRPERLWAAGYPTLDVYFAGRLVPYPQGWDYEGTEAAHRLTPAEYFSLYAGLPPARTRGDLDWAGVLRAVTSWVDQHPGSAERFPVPPLLEHARMMAGR